MNDEICVKMSTIESLLEASKRLIEESKKILEELEEDYNPWSSDAAYHDWKENPYVPGEGELSLTRGNLRDMEEPHNEPE
jgi:hypothetical protein